MTQPATRCGYVYPGEEHLGACGVEKHAHDTLAHAFVEPQSPAADTDRDPVGTTYLAPNGDTYRLVRYEVPFSAMHTDDEYEEPVYDFWSAGGGAARGVPLPEGCVRVVLPTPERPAPGSLFVTPDGTAYRLRDYGVDWTAEPYTGEHTRPTYTVQGIKGMSSNADTLPADARLVWAPPSA